MKKIIYIFFILSIVIAGIFPNFSYAQDFNRDLFIKPEGVNVIDNILVGENVRIYVTVHNNSDYDLVGVVKFYDENKKSFIGEDQPVSVIAHKTDDVFVDWVGSSIGSHSISIRVLPWNQEGDDTSNNKVTKIIYVDKDTDGDGIGDKNDSDIDGDGVPNHLDAFPYDPNESEDTDGDGIGNNADTDDDGDVVPDIEDVFPLDPAEQLDSDSDGVGDNSDAFPSNPTEWVDSDGDGLGDNSDPDNENHGPVPTIETEKTTVGKNKIITFSALSSHDPDGEVVDYKWNFGDGKEANGVIIDHIFEKTGDYDVSLKVTDNKGEIREQTILIKVVPRWQTIALIIATLLLILLLIGRLFIASDERNKKISGKKKSLSKEYPILKTKRKKVLPKKRK